MLSVPDWREFPCVAFEDRKKLPDSTGIYIVTSDHEEKPLYIGRAKDQSIRRRHLTHNNLDLFIEHNASRIYYCQIDDVDTIDGWEILLIGNEKPLLNKKYNPAKSDLVGFTKKSATLLPFSNGLWDVINQEMKDGDYEEKCLYPFMNSFGGQLPTLPEFNPVLRENNQPFSDFFLEQLNTPKLSTFNKLFSFLPCDQKRENILFVFALAKCIKTLWLSNVKKYIAFYYSSDQYRQEIMSDILLTLFERIAGTAHQRSTERLDISREETKEQWTSAEVISMKQRTTISIDYFRDEVIEGKGTRDCSSGFKLIKEIVLGPYYFKGSFIAMVSCKKQTNINKIPYIKTNAINFIVPKNCPNNSYYNNTSLIDEDLRNEIPALLNIILPDQNLPKETAFKWLGIKE